MDDGSHRENGRHKVDPYKTSQGQWMMQQHAPSMKQVMAMMTERDAAISERNLALAEKKAALAERDMAYLQRDAAIAERNNALMERDSAVAALQYRDSSLTNNNNGSNNNNSSNNNNNNNMSTCPPGCQISRGVKHMHHPQYDAPYGASDQIPMMSSPSRDPSDEGRSRRGKRAKEPKPGSQTKPPRKKSNNGNGNGNGSRIGYGRSSSQEWKGAIDGGDSAARSSDWKDQDLGLNQVLYDESTMPAPACSCTGVVRQCYKWGNGGWQSSCCTTTMSIYPLPAVPNKRHARVGGRKMSGSAFNKLLSRLAAEGHDLSNPVDLKDNWAKHGTNRYITIK